MKKTENKRLSGMLTILLRSNAPAMNPERFLFGEKAAVERVEEVEGVAVV